MNLRETIAFYLATHGYSLAAPNGIWLFPDGTTGTIADAVTHCLASEGTTL